MPKTDFKKLEDHISRDPETFLKTMGYHGSVRNGEFITGDIHGAPGESFSINLRKALFYDFNGDAVEKSGGGWIGLIAKKLSVDPKVAAERIIEKMGWNTSDFAMKDSSRSARPDQAIMPVPANAEEIPYKIGGPLKSHPDMRLASIYEYRNVNNELMHCVLRFETDAGPGGKAEKQIRPLSYFGPNVGWQMKGPSQNTLFGLELLEQNPLANVILVEGEKTALAAREIFPDHVCLTWPGGSGSISKVDWAPLSGCHVVYWPDADKAGQKTITPIQHALGLITVASLRVVPTFGRMPNKWDLADPLPDGIDINELWADAKLLDTSSLKQLMDASYAELPDSWFYIAESEEFYHLPGMKETFRHLPEAKRSSASNRFLEDFVDNKLVKRLYRPGIYDEIVVDDGIRALNTWRPSEVKPLQGDAIIFVEHLLYLAGNERDFSHLADMLAYMVQNLGKKIKSAPILVGKQGTGKSYVGDVMCVLLGEHNCRIIETQELKSDFSDYMEDTMLVIIEEVMALGRKDILNSLKTKITQPVIPLRKKYEHGRNIVNTTNFIAFTNHPDALPLEKGERRYFAAGTDAEKQDQKYYDQLWKWTEENYGVILNWLLNRDLSNFSPNARPPLTAAKQEMILSSRPLVEAEIARMIEEQEHPFDLDLIEVKVVLQVLREYMREANLSTVQKGLRANGAKNLGQKTALYGRRKRKVSLWAVRNIEKWESASPTSVARAYFDRQLGPNSEDDDLFKED